MTTSIMKKIAINSKQFQGEEKDTKSKSPIETTSKQKPPKALEKKSKEIYQQKIKNRELAAARKQEKKATRENRNRILMHAGGLLDMTGLLRYCFNNADEFDNPQDNLRANLLVGSLLHLSEYLYNCSPDDLAKIEAAGKLFRSSDKKNRDLIGTNPALTNAKSVRPLLIHESNSYKNRNAGRVAPTDDL
ncbi:MAG: hypothetical protein L0H10_03510 [Comamonas sp.]|uniref:hypothetical protein n=1 Tax=Comamonas sp. TaxID=34028 RepID=UPI0026478ABB|nr:hypothetical protein [Comamonas sp.]MDN5502879.1 hypothetical protein [Comamonas sp.]MDN5539083.1 hypothetical protein [Comamonas sp.]